MMFEKIHEVTGLPLHRCYDIERGHNTEIITSLSHNIHQVDRYEYQIGKKVLTHRQGRTGQPMEIIHTWDLGDQS